MRAVLEHGSEKHRRMTLDHLLEGLLEFSTNEQGSKSVTKALKEGGKDTLDRVVKRMCEPAKGYVLYLMIGKEDLNAMKCPARYDCRSRPFSYRKPTYRQRFAHGQCSL